MARELRFRPAPRRSSAGRRRPDRGRTQARRAGRVNEGSPQERAVDDRELEPLAAVDRQHLDSLGIGLEPPRAVLVAALPARRRRSARAASPRSAVAPEPLGGRRLVQELADVAQVRHPALPVPGWNASRRAGMSSSSESGRASAATPPRAQDPTPPVQALVDVLPRRFAGARDRRRAPAEERRQRCCACAPGWGSSGARSAPSSASQSRADAVAQHAAARR